jgi:hypothetical protein
VQANKTKSCKRSRGPADGHSWESRQQESAGSVCSQMSLNKEAHCCGGQWGQPLMMKRKEKEYQSGVSAMPAVAGRLPEEVGLWRCQMLNSCSLHTAVLV